MIEIVRFIQDVIAKERAGVYQVNHKNFEEDIWFLVGLVIQWTFKLTEKR